MSLTLACSQGEESRTASSSTSQENHLSNVKQLTFGGENAEAYFSIDDLHLIFQRTNEPQQCDQIFTMTVEGKNLRLVSTGQGRTTCPYYFPDARKILYSSTHLHNAACPPRPDYSRGYVWALYPAFDVFIADSDGGNLRRLTQTWRYDAEATISRDGSRIVFTSLRDGDLDIYATNSDGSNVQRLTDALGYDGGPFFSYDGTQIVYRAYHPETEEEKQDYLALLEQDLIRPTRLDIHVMNADGSDKRRLTDNAAANFAPYFFPTGDRIIFASNVHNPGGRNFDLYVINTDGTGLERITHHPDFDSFPMFNSDGTRLVWASNRDQSAPGETNIFIADWIESPTN